MENNRQEFVQPRKVSPNKVCSYIRAAYLDGKTRISAYAENIDPNLYRANYRYQFELIEKLESRDDFEELKTMIMEEDMKDMMLRSSSAQRKAFDLLNSTLEAAQKAVESTPDDPKVLQAASTVLKTLAPALQSIQKDDEPDRKKIGSRRAKVAQIISGDIK